MLQSCTPDWSGMSGEGDHRSVPHAVPSGVKELRHVHCERKYDYHPQFEVTPDCNLDQSQLWKEETPLWLWLRSVPMICLHMSALDMGGWSKLWLFRATESVPQQPNCQTIELWTNLFRLIPRHEVQSGHVEWRDRKGRCSGFSYLHTSAILSSWHWIYSCWNRYGTCW